MQAMEFITLTTGGASMSPRSGVADDVVERIRHALARDGNLWAGWSVELDKSPRGAVSFRLLLHDVPLSRCMVVWDEAVSDLAWETVQEAVPDRVVVHRPRGVPWLAVDILPAAIAPTTPAEALMELADAEQCVAWTLIEGLTDGR
jgi:hypothetical protein